MFDDPGLKFISGRFLCSELNKRDKLIKPAPDTFTHERSHSVNYIFLIKAKLNKWVRISHAE